MIFCTRFYSSLPKSLREKILKNKDKKKNKNKNVFQYSETCELDPFTSIFLFIRKRNLYSQLNIKHIKSGIRI